jgi:hypothetical protein
MRFPYGIADFRKIREEGYFYVDRSDRIALLEEAGSQLLFLRPRRFGKSLWLSTLENYSFPIQVVECLNTGQSY